LLRKDQQAIGTIGIAVYEAGEKGIESDGSILYALGNELYSAEVSRPLGGFVSWDISPLDLAPGTYYIEARQLSATKSIQLAFDEVTSGSFYLSYEEDSELYIGQVRYSSGYPIGNIALRANFTPYQYNSIHTVRNTEVDVYTADNLLYVTADREMDQITINDVKGSVVYRSAHGLNTDRYSVNIANWAKGVYIVRIATPSDSKTVKFIVK
jgi:hypothetical protein